jgi:hypothetical protein
MKPKEAIEFQIKEREGYKQNVPLMSLVDQLTEICDK